MRFSRFSACSESPALDVSRATFELYPKIKILAYGALDGRKSRSQSLLVFSEVQVFSACNSVFLGLRPWTATMLASFVSLERSI
jgi:hypothetical protein